MKNLNFKNKNKLKKDSVNKKSNVLKHKIECDNKKSKMLMSFDEYYDKNVSKDDKNEIEFQTELIGKLIEIRNSKKITQRKLAQICNVKQPEIARIESFKCSPQINTLIKLLIPLGYTLKIESIRK